MAEAAGAKAIQRRKITKVGHESIGSTVGIDTKITKKHLSKHRLVDTIDLRQSETNFQTASRNNRDDERFVSSMRLCRNLDGFTSRHPLHLAISKGSEIDVQMILDELGPFAAASIQWSDYEGRTALHIAALSKNKKISGVLLNHYRRSEGRQLSAELITLEEEFRETTAKVWQQSIDYTSPSKPL